jgi:hypothetical protein
MEPASKVSVPLTVVMRTRSRVPPRAMFPPDKADIPAFEKDMFELFTHVVPVIKVITA